MSSGEPYAPGGLELPPGGVEPPKRSMRPLGIAIVAVLVVAVVGIAGFAIVQGLGPSASPHPPGSFTAGASPSSAPTNGLPSGAPTKTPKPGTTPKPGATPGPTGTPAPTGDVAMPIVPVVGFWSSASDISTTDLKAALQGQNATYGKVSISAADRDALGQALGITVDASVQSGDAAEVISQVKGGALGLMRASDVGPSVRALSIDGKALFGEARVKQTSDWPLVLTVQAPLDQAWDQSKTWTLLAGGDMFLDRGVRRMVVAHGNNPDYPFDGGTARVTGHHCCGQYVTIHPVADVQLTGNKGAVRDLTKGADLTIANLENPVPDNWVYHAHNYIFSGDPALLSMFTDAGVDWVTIANNHIRDFGSQGVIDTTKNLAAAGLGYGGAGKDIAEAAKISYLDANGNKVAIIACVDVGAYATTTSAGGLPCHSSLVVSDIKQARKRADAVIVFAHWGYEYSRTPLGSQRALAIIWVRAGATTILGAHTHVAGAIEEIDGHVVVYSMGDFVFDQDWWTITMESFLPEMTFEGGRLVQMTLHPFVMADQAQPNLLDPATDDGKALLRAIRGASTHLDW